MVCEAVMGKQKPIPVNGLYDEIVVLQKEGLTLREIARDKHVHFSTICQIVLAHLREN